MENKMFYLEQMGCELAKLIGMIKAHLTDSERVSAVGSDIDILKCAISNEMDLIVSIARGDDYAEMAKIRGLIQKYLSVTCNDRFCGALFSSLIDMLETLFVDMASRHDEAVVDANQRV